MKLITFAQARDFVVPFGQHKGKTVDQVAETDEGLCYLGWLHGERSKQRGRAPIDIALLTYLNDPTIAKDLDRLQAGAYRGHGHVR